MNLSIGIVGLPNVGKSTLFNALTNSTVEAQNYPFCTIEPNKGIVPIKDSRLDKLAEIEKSKRKVNAVVEFVDIAGLVKGAATGAGLGNQFLSHIREVAAIAHVVRDFEDDNIIHVDGKIDPTSDIETIELELILKDIETLQKRMATIQAKARSDKKAMQEYEWMDGLLKHLESGQRAFDYDSEGISEEVIIARKSMCLLTDKPQLYIINKRIENENDTKSSLTTKPNIAMDIKLEYELSQLDDEEKKEYLSEFNLEYTGLERLTRACFELLGLCNFFTAGEQESRSWTIQLDTKAQGAAGAIHTDFAKNFIAADVVSYESFVEFNGWNGAREHGKVRLEGKDYVVKDGDIIIFKHN
ncbi:redox-regulated ATPase YchF [Candidatus Dojkabacteria bacterium]|uniref:Ribosome-binding ATPase YchF n=1 Tax=Candidatus Dojkabacteria bacterium TaxID=2099670 RepID=A0A955RKM9_9BACT|nr:redox-regulated ATPase YchF [Candidatus Dojkabacteria bacterium]